MSIIIPHRVKERIIHWADRDETTGCLISRYSVGSHGYAQIGWGSGGGKIVTIAHRALWIAENGPLPEGMTVDHICHNRKCVEISHLRTLSNLDNARRNGPTDWPLGFCKRGHDDSWWHPKSSTNQKGYCHACRSERQAEARGSTYRFNTSEPRPSMSHPPSNN